MDDNSWFYHDGDNPFGPMSLSEIEKRILLNQVKTEYLVIKEGDAKWVPAIKHPLLSKLFAKSESSEEEKQSESLWIVLKTDPDDVEKTKQLGPFRESEITRKIKTGEISYQDHIWQDGKATWTKVADEPLFSKDDNFDHQNKDKIEKKSDELPPSEDVDITAIIQVPPRISKEKKSSLEEEISSHKSSEKSESSIQSDLEPENKKSAWDIDADDEVTQPDIEELERNVNLEAVAPELPKFKIKKTSHKPINISNKNEIEKSDEKALGNKSRDGESVDRHGEPKTQSTEIKSERQIVLDTSEETLKPPLPKKVKKSKKKKSKNSDQIKDLDLAKKNIKKSSNKEKVQDLKEPGDSSSEYEEYESLKESLEEDYIDDVSVIDKTHSEELMDKAKVSQLSQILDSDVLLETKSEDESSPEKSVKPANKLKTSKIKKSKPKAGQGKKSRSRLSVSRMKPQEYLGIFVFLVALGLLAMVVKKKFFPTGIQSEKKVSQSPSTRSQRKKSSGKSNKKRRERAIESRQLKQETEELTKSASFIRTKIVKNKGRDFKVQLKTDAGSRVKVGVVIESKYSDNERGRSYYLRKWLSTKKRGQYEFDMKWFKLPQGKYNLKFYAGDVEKNIAIFYGVNNSEYRRNRRMKVKMNSFYYSKEKRQLFGFIRGLEKVYNGMKGASSSRTKWRSSYSDWKRSLRALKSRKMNVKSNGSPNRVYFVNVWKKYRDFYRKLDFELGKNNRQVRKRNSVTFTPELAKSYNELKTAYYTL